MLVGAKLCDLTEDILWFVCGLYVGILTSSLIYTKDVSQMSTTVFFWKYCESNHIKTSP